MHALRLARLDLLQLPVCSGLVLAQAHSGSPADWRAIDRYIRAEMELNEIPGLTLVIVQGNTVFTRACGVKSLRTAEPMRRMLSGSLARIQTRSPSPSAPAVW